MTPRRAESVAELDALPASAMWVDLTGTGADWLDDSVLPRLKRFKRLRRLEVQGGYDAVTDKGMARLASYRTLRELTLWCCNALTDRALDSLAALPELQTLEVVTCWTLRDATMAKVAALPALSQVDLTQTQG